MSPEVAALVPWDVAIFMVAIVCQNADINMSGLGVNHSGAIGDCAIAGGCASCDSDCDGDVLWLCRRQWGEAAEQVSYNADINICMLVNCFCAVGGCAIAGGDSDCDGDVPWLCRRQGGETAA